MKTNNKNKHSARKKLFPAIAMLTTSAIMLSTATYAWFTMNKEVEVTGIKLTATVPASMQISLGYVEGDGETKTLKSPANTNESTDWSDIVAFSDTYKSFGTLMPASSTDGNKLYYTDDATGVGQTIASNAEFKVATDSEKATLSLKENDSTVASGRYVDIPVWFRTSETGTGNVELSVKADITEGTSNTGLYKAARVSILDSTLETDIGTHNQVIYTVTEDSSSGVIQGTGAEYYNDKSTSGNYAVKQTGTYSGKDNDTLYGVPTFVDQFDKTHSIKGTTVVEVAKNDSNDQTKIYGNTTKKIIRVWLEGEDKACWNANAGQSFNINLTFIDKSTIQGS